MGIFYIVCSARHSGIRRSICARFCDIVGCTYIAKVVVTLECPRISESDFVSKPASMHRVANVCLSAWNV